ncbi:MAG: YbaN family protein [Pirellulaceae bacterium]|nr:YbaN family protein [Pirellulaceae bacterium]
MRYAFAFLGLFFVGLGAIGVFLPGIPTTGPLLLASFLFTKSCPYLEQRLIRNRFFGRYLKYLDDREPMPMRAKIAAIVMMWVSIVVSCAIFCLLPQPHYWSAIICIFLGGVGTWFIINFRRHLEPGRRLA